MHGASDTVSFLPWQMILNIPEFVQLTSLHDRSLTENPTHSTPQCLGTVNHKQYRLFLGQTALDQIFK